MARGNLSAIFLLLLLVAISQIYAGKEAIVLVGEHLSAEKVPFEESCPELDCYVLDGAFDGQYKVRQVVRGTFNGDIVSFRQQFQYGLPYFYRTKFALLFLHRSENGIEGMWPDGDGPVLGWLGGIDVQKTRKGKFYWCPPPDVASEWVHHLVSVHFDPEVEIDIRHLNQPAIDAIVTTPFYIKRRNVAKCVGGVPLDVIVDQALEANGRK